jgi:hypothetical protein
MNKRQRKKRFKKESNWRYYFKLVALDFEFEDCSSLITPLDMNPFRTEFNRPGPGECVFTRAYLLKILNPYLSEEYLKEVRVSMEPDEVKKRIYGKFPDFLQGVPHE